MIRGENDSIISGTVPLVNERVRRCSSASQKVARRAPVSSAADSEMARSSASSSSVLGLVERGVPDRDGRLLGQELERGDLLAPKGMLGPVVDDQRAEDAILRGERGRRRGLEALPLDVSAAGGR